jgi:cystinosin
VAWGLSSYPQLIRNFQRKSVEGYSLEFQLWNITGFTFYLLYTTIGYWQQHTTPGLTHSITINDITFAGHAFCMNIALSIQCIVWGKTNKQGISRVHVGMVCGLWLLAFYNVFLGAGGFLPWFSHSSSSYSFSVVQFLGFGKSFVSFVKYTPQVYLNWLRKSTSGWSIVNTLLDFLGGLLSFSQMVVIAYDKTDANGNPDWSQVTSNIPKLVLAIESMLFDVIMMVQHYCLYGPRGADAAADELSHANDGLLLGSHGAFPSPVSDAALYEADARDAAHAGTLYGHGNPTIQRHKYVRFDN